MAYSEQKIIDFNNAHSKRRMSVKESNRPLISKGKQVVSGNFQKILKVFFEKIDDELFALSDKAENSTLQASYFDAMRYVRKERSRMQRCYLGLIERGYDAFWSGDPRAVVENRQPEEDEFCLVENEMLEEDLAVITMTDKGENRYYSELYALNKRFAALLKVDELDKNQNPVAPAQLCQAFRETLDPLTLDLAIKLVIYKLFDRLVLSNVGVVYKELNTLLISQGILPKIQKKIKRQKGVSLPASLGGQQAESIEPNDGGYTDEAFAAEEMSSEQFEFFRSLQNLVGAHRQSHGGGYASSSGSMGPAYEMNEVMDILSVVQGNALNSGSGMLPQGDNLKIYLANALGKLQPGSEQRPFASVEEDVIDMVGMIFDYILEDKNLPDPIKALLGRLQIPMLKVAILDKGFFARKGHSARALLNELAKAGVELSNSDCNDSNPLFSEIAGVVEQILSEFDQNSGLFEELLEGFGSFLERNEKRSQVLEERTLQVTESKEKLLLAKKQTAYEMAKQMQGKMIPAVVKDFIEESWKDVIILAALRADREPEGVERSVAVINKLIESVTPPSSAEEKQKILRSIPLLLKEIRVGLENISIDSHEMARFFKDLEHCHVVSLKGTHEAENEIVEEAVLLPAKSEEELEQACDALFDEMVTSASTVDQLGNVTPSDKSDFGAEEIILSSNPVVMEEVLNDASMGKAKSLEVGQWLEMDCDDGKAIRLKLSWRSQVTSMYVFVDRKGLKVKELSQQGLAAEFRRGALRIIEEAKVPLMDRALAAMMTSLKVASEGSETVTQ